MSDSDSNFLKLLKEDEKVYIKVENITTDSNNNINSSVSDKKKTESKEETNNNEKLRKMDTINLNSIRISRSFGRMNDSTIINDLYDAMDFSACEKNNPNFHIKKKKSHQQEEKKPSSKKKKKKEENGNNTRNKEQKYEVLSKEVKNKLIQMDKIFQEKPDVKINNNNKLFYISKTTYQINKSNNSNDKNNININIQNCPSKVKEIIKDKIENKVQSKISKKVKISRTPIQVEYDFDDEVRNVKLTKYKNSSQKNTTNNSMKQIEFDIEINNILNILYSSKSPNDKVDILKSMLNKYKNISTEKNKKNVAKKRGTGKYDKIKKDMFITNIEKKGTRLNLFNSSKCNKTINPERSILYTYQTNSLKHLNIGKKKITKRNNLKNQKDINQSYNRSTDEGKTINLKKIINLTRCKKSSSKKGNFLHINKYIPYLSYQSPKKIFNIPRRNKNTNKNLNFSKCENVSKTRINTTNPIFIKFKNKNINIDQEIKATKKKILHLK